jgi:cytochrome c biogenesis protein CcdA
MVPTPDTLSTQPAEMTLTVVLWMGVLAALNMCAVVRLPVLAGSVAGAGTSRKHAMVLAVLVAVGLGAGTWLLGQTAIPAADGVHKILQVNKTTFWILGSCLIAIGVLVSGLVNLPLVPEKWRRIGRQLAPTTVPGALLLGLVLGLLQTPVCPTCRTQLLAVVEAVPSQASGPVLLVGFGAGLSLAALGVGLTVALLKPRLFGWLRTQMCSVEQRVQLLTGNMLVVFGIYFLIVG